MSVKQSSKSIANSLKNNNISKDYTFDLFSHLKSNIKFYSKNCELHDSLNNHYCINCKQAICDICVSSFHSTHNYKKKEDFPNNSNIFIKSLSDLEEEIKILEENIQPNLLIKNYKQLIETEMNSIIEKVQELKIKRLKEFDNMFSSNNNSFECKKLKNNIKKTKDNIFSYFNKNQSFFNENPNNNNNIIKNKKDELKTKNTGLTIDSKVNDEDNFILLHKIDIYQEIQDKISQYKAIIHQIKSTYSNIQNFEDSKFTELLKLLDTILIEQKKKEIKLANNKIWDDIDCNKKTMNFDTDNLRSIKQLKDNSNSVALKMNKLFQRINEDLFVNLRDKIDKYELFNNSFVDQIINSLKKNHSLKEIEKIVKIFEEKLAKKVDIAPGSRKINLNKSTKSRIDLGRRESLYSNKSKSSGKSEGSNLYSKRNFNNTSSVNNSSSKNCIENNKTSHSISANKRNRMKFIDNSFNKKQTNNFNNNTNFKRQMTHVEENFEKEDCVEDDVSTSKNHTKRLKIKVDPNIIGNDVVADFNNNEYNKFEDNVFHTEEEHILDDVSFKYKTRKDKFLDIYKKTDKVFMPKKDVKFIKSINAKNKDMKNNANSNTYKLHNNLLDKVEEENKISKIISSKEAMLLTVPLIRKYYSFMMIDFFRTINKENESNKGTSTSNLNKGNSIKELFEKSTKLQNDKEDDTDRNIQIKIIEGSNEIQIYNKKLNKIRKEKVNLIQNFNLLNTKVFYIGCRSVKLKDKIYISGGKDVNGDKQMFLCYSTLTKNITKLSDMKYPRSFHTFFYHKNLRALIALGGENNNSCEMYDFYLNNWNDLPEMNYPRANVNFIVNNAGTLAYAMFGIVGDIANQNKYITESPVNLFNNKKNLSDIIEVIDLVDMNKGWYKVDYINNTGVDLKSSELKVSLINNNKMLIYGGLEPRNPTPQNLVFDLNSLEMHKISGPEIAVLKAACNKE